ncbi:hypothetical protein GE09DRAFT_1095508 [Coniochaeta sp. 2T2.1]|nr:hypothetical protein GE09DRAFT_1095508 [Coniochaeta sp. 2T2.1]
MPPKDRRPHQPKPQSPPPPASSSSPSLEDPNPGPRPVQITFDLLLTTIKTATRQAYGGSPPFTREASDAFRSYWYGVFTRLAANVATRQEIPQFLTLPAVRKFNVTLYDESGAGGMCPCCLPPDSHPEVVELRNEKTGVTKVDLVVALRDALYGKKDRRVAPGEEMQKPPDVEEEKDGDREGQGQGGEEVDRLVFDAEWMVGPVEGPEGERYTHQFCYGEDADDVCNIWVFWSTWRRFRENVRDMEKVRAGDTGGGACG